MSAPDRWTVLESCPLADEAVWLRHAARFSEVFVAPARRGRWADLLARRPRRIGGDSHKLRSDLDRRTCRLVNQLPVGLRGDGVLYAFADAPRVVPVDVVAVAAGGGDALFSLVPGELAVYFFHEGELWLCQPPRPT